MHLSPRVALAPVRSKAVVLLLLNCCLVCFPLAVGALCLSLFYCALLCVLSSFQSSSRGGFVTVNVVTLPHGAVVRSAVCDCGIS